MSRGARRWPTGDRAMLRLAVPVVVVAAIAATAAGASGSGTAARLRIGYVPDITVRDSPVESLAVAGLRRAVRRLGVEGLVRTPIPREGYAASLTALAARGYDLVIGFGQIEVGALARVARRYPKTRFAILDVSHAELPHRPRNVTGIVFREQEVGYLAGYLAGLVERRRPGRDVVSAVGGFPIPPVDRYIAGYRAGARKADPRIRVLYGYAYSFLDPDRCAAVASSQIGKGSGVVFDVAGACGDGALRAAGRHRGVWGVGVDLEQAALGPYILTSALKRLDVAVFETVRALQRGRLRGGGDVFYGLREGGVGLGRISPRVPRSFVARVARIRRAIAAGRIRVPATLR